MTFAIDALPELLSLEVTADLVAQGLRAPWRNGVSVGDAQTFTLDVLDASNTSPIVITVPANSLTIDDDKIGVRAGVKVLHVVIAGVTGNTAANNLNEETLRNSAWYAVVTSPTTLALYDLDNNTGALVPSVGNGAYAGGGTVSKAFVEGAILVGREHVSENSSPPRIVMIPMAVQDEAPTGFSAMTAAAFAEGERDRQRISPPIRTDLLWWEVHVWGGGGVRFGPTLALAQAVKRAAHLRGNGSYEIGRGDWLDQHPDAPQRLKVGRNFAFQLGLRTPITRAAVELAPADIEPDLTMYLRHAEGTPEEA